MKKILTMLILSVALLGCGGEKTGEIEKANRSNAQNTGIKTQTNVNRGANFATSQMPQSGEKVEQLLEINFKDGLPKGWEAVDPEKENPSEFDTSGGVLRLKIPSGKDLYGENRTSPRLLKTVAGDFEIETRVKFSPGQSYQGAGLIIFRNDNNYLRLERGFGGVGGGDGGIRFDKREDETYEPVATQEKFPTEAREVELKYRRVGKNFTAFWREAGKNDWIEVGKVTNSYPDAVRIGLIGVNTADEITAEFAYIKLSPFVK